MLKGLTSVRDNSLNSEDLIHIFDGLYIHCFISFILTDLHHFLCAQFCILFYPT